MGHHMRTLTPREKANILVMTSRPNEVRIVSADFDATGRPYWSVVLKNLSEGAKLTRLLYTGDFMVAWYALRATNRGFRLAADSLWWETRRYLVNWRVNVVMSGGFLMHDSDWATSEPPRVFWDVGGAEDISHMATSPSSEP